MWRDIRSGLIGGGAVAVGVFLAGFVLRVSSDVMAIGLGLVFVVGAVAAMLAFEGRRRPQPVSQPVSQPVVQPVAVVRDNSFDGRQPLPVINNYRAQPPKPVTDEAAPPVETAPQPVADRANGHAQPAPDWASTQSVGFGARPPLISVEYPAIGLSWPDMVRRQSGSAEPSPGSSSPEVARGSTEAAATVESDDVAGGDGQRADGALLPRREPTLTDYPLIWEVIEGTRSQNEAIRELWGSKDGRTFGWLRKVRDFYILRPAIEHTRAGIILYEVTGSCDTLAIVAARLGVSFEEVEAVVKSADLLRCGECGAWTSEPDLDVLGMCFSCGS